MRTRRGFKSSAEVSSEPSIKTASSLRDDNNDEVSSVGSAYSIPEISPKMLTSPGSESDRVNQSALFRYWKVGCIQAWLCFIFFEAYVYYDRKNSAKPLCPHSDKDFGAVYWYINYAVLGGFVITLMSMITKLLYSDPLFETVPILVAVNIVSMGVIATTLALVFEWGGVCIDQLNVASPAAIWAEWIATAPLIVLVVVTVVDKKDLSSWDIVVMTSFFLCCVFGFFIVYEQPRSLALFWLSLSMLTYLPMLQLPWYDDSQQYCDDSNPAMLELITWMKMKRFQIRYACLPACFSCMYVSSYLLSVCISACLCIAHVSIKPFMPNIHSFITFGSLGSLAFPRS